MDLKYEIVKYTADFKGQVVELQKHLWSADSELNSAYLEWKYERNPYLSEPRIYLVMCDDRVVGMRGVYGAKWETGSPSQRFLCPCSGDLVIAPDHRRRGLVYELMAAIVDDPANSAHEYVFSLSASPATYVASVKTGWRSVGPPQTHERVRKISTVPNSSLDSPLRRTSLGRLYSRTRRIFRRLRTGDPAGKENPFHRLDRAASLTEAEGDPFVTVAREPDCDAMAQLVERIGNGERIGHVRDREYFAWRFKNPLSRYRFLYWKDPMLKGYLVLQAWANPRRRGAVNIVDWEAATPRARKELLDAALRWGKFETVRIWCATLPDEAKTLLAGAGFEPWETREGHGRGLYASAHRGGVLVRPVRDEMLKGSDWTLGNRKVLDMSHWDLRMIYSDDF
jgi:hypothetical protein